MLSKKIFSFLFPCLVVFCTFSLVYAQEENIPLRTLNATSLASANGNIALEDVAYINSVTMKVNDQFLTSDPDTTVTFDGKNGTPRAAVSISFTFKDNIDIDPGTTFTYYVSSNLINYTPTSGHLYYKGEDVGTYELSVAAKSMKVTYTSNSFCNAYSRSSTIEFTADINSTAALIEFNYPGPFVFYMKYQTPPHLEIEYDVKECSFSPAPKDQNIIRIKSIGKNTNVFVSSVLEEYKKFGHMIGEPVYIEISKNGDHKSASELNVCTNDLATPYRKSPLLVNIVKNKSDTNFTVNSIYNGPDITQLVVNEASLSMTNNELNFIIEELDDGEDIIISFYSFLNADGYLQSGRIKRVYTDYRGSRTEVDYQTKNRVESGTYNTITINSDQTETMTVRKNIYPEMDWIDIKAYTVSKENGGYLTYSDRRESADVIKYVITFTDGNINPLRLFSLPTKPSITLKTYKDNQTINLPLNYVMRQRYESASTYSPYQSNVTNSNVQWGNNVYSALYFGPGKNTLEFTIPACSEDYDGKGIVLEASLTGNDSNLNLNLNDTETFLLNPATQAVKLNGVWYLQKQWNGDRITCTVSVENLAASKSILSYKDPGATGKYTPAHLVGSKIQANTENNNIVVNETVTSGYMNINYPYGNTSSSGNFPKFVVLKLTEEDADTNVGSLIEKYGDSYLTSDKLIYIDGVGNVNNLGTTIDESSVTVTNSAISFTADKLEPSESLLVLYYITPSSNYYTSYNQANFPLDNAYSYLAVSSDESETVNALERVSKISKTHIDVLLSEPLSGENGVVETIENGIISTSVADSTQVTLDMNAGDFTDANEWKVTTEISGMVPDPNMAVHLNTYDENNELVTQTVIPWSEFSVSGGYPLDTYHWKAMFYLPADCGDANEITVAARVVGALDDSLSVRYYDKSDTASFISSKVCSGNLTVDKNVFKTSKQFIGENEYSVHYSFGIKITAEGTNKDVVINDTMGEYLQLGIQEDDGFTGFPLLFVHRLKSDQYKNLSVSELLNLDELQRNFPTPFFTNNSNIETVVSVGNGYNRDTFTASCPQLSPVSCLDANYSQWDFSRNSFTMKFNELKDGEVLFIHYYVSLSGDGYKDLGENPTPFYKTTIKDKLTNTVSATSLQMASPVTSQVTIDPNKNWLDQTANLQSKADGGKLKTIDNGAVTVVDDSVINIKITTNDGDYLNAPNYLLNLDFDSYTPPDNILVHRTYQDGMDSTKEQDLSLVEFLNLISNPNTLSRSAKNVFEFSLPACDTTRDTFNLNSSFQNASILSCTSDLASTCTRETITANGVNNINYPDNFCELPDIGLSKQVTYTSSTYPDAAYTIVANPGARKINNGNDLKLSDELGTGLTYIKNSFILDGTNLSQERIIFGTNQDNHETFSINVSDSAAHTLTYTAKVTLPQGTPFTEENGKNTVVLKNSSDSILASAEAAITGEVFRIGAKASFDTTTITVLKKNEHGEFLPSATFSLKYIGYSDGVVNIDDETELGNYISDAQGKITPIIMRDHVVEISELTAPPNYLKSDEIIYIVFSGNSNIDWSNVSFKNGNNESIDPSSIMFLVDDSDSTFSFVNREGVHLKIKKFWEDDSNRDEFRPESISVRIKNGNSVLETVELSGTSDVWSYETGLYPKYDNALNEIPYSLEEVFPDTP